jgi:hypothetical protein
MNDQVTTDQIAELTFLISALEAKQNSLTQEEHDLLNPIMKAAEPLLDALEDVLIELDEEEEDWS